MSFTSQRVQNYRDANKFIMYFQYVVDIAQVCQSSLDLVPSLSGLILS